MHDDDLSPILRDAYADAPKTAIPSETLWERTRWGWRLQRRRRPPVWMGAVVAAAAALLIGFVAGMTWEGRHGNTLPVTADTPVTAAEQVQSTGSAYAEALNALVQNLTTASADELVTSQNIVLAVSRAQAAPLGVLLANHPDSRHLEARPVLWF